MIEAKSYTVTEVGIVGNDDNVRLVFKSLKSCTSNDARFFWPDP